MNLYQRFFAMIMSGLFFGLVIVALTDWLNLFVLGNPFRGVIESVIATGWEVKFLGAGLLLLVLGRLAVWLGLPDDSF